MTVALVDDGLRVQKLETWFDSADMFRQIAPAGIVNRAAVDHKAGRAPGELIDDVMGDGVKQAEAAKEEGGKDAADPAPGSAAVHTETEEPNDTSPETATKPAEPAPTPIDPIPASTTPTGTTTPSPSHPPALTSNVVPPSPTSTTTASTSTTTPYTTATALSPLPIASLKPTPPDDPSLTPGSTSAASNPAVPAGAHGPTAADSVPPYPFPQDMADRVRPAPGEAVVAGAVSEEAERTWEEMSRVGGVECPFMNRE